MEDYNNADFSVLQYLENNFIILTKIEPIISKIIKEHEEMFNPDGTLKPKYAEKCEETYRELSRMDWRDLYRPFTI